MIIYLMKVKNMLTRKICYFKNQTGWADLLHRFIKGGGSIWDIEFMTDENGK